MKLKRIIAIACTAAMTVSLISGCGGASDKGQKEAVKEAEGTAKEDLPLAKYPETVTVHLGGKMNPNAKIPKGMSFEDNSYTILTFEGGTEVLVEVGTNNYISLPRWYVLGEDGTAVIRDWQLNGEIIRKTGITEEKVVPVKTAAGLTKTMAPRREDTIVKEELPHVSGDIADFHRNVAAVIRDGAEPEIKLFQVMRVMKLMEAIFQSAETNQVIDYRQYES